jgi:antirestriction protein ArdC
MLRNVPFRIFENIHKVLRKHLGFLFADLEIKPKQYDDASYIAHWLKALKDDKRFIFSASSHAQKAADYLHSLQPGYVKAVDKPETFVGREIERRENAESQRTAI